MRLSLLACLWASTASASTVYLVDRDTDELLRYNTASHTVATVGPLGVDFAYGSLAWDAGGQVMYMTDGGRSLMSLYTVNLATGAATLVGTHGVEDLWGMAFNPHDGLIYAGPGLVEAVYTIDPATAAASLLGYTPGFAMGGADWDPHLDGIVFNQAPNQAFYWFDLPSLTPIYLGEGVDALDDPGLAWDEAGGLYWSFDVYGGVASYDPATAFAVTYVGHIGRSVTAAEIADNASDLRVTRASGTCPGPESFLMTGAQPGGRVAFVAGAPGPATIPTGVCAGTAIGVQGARVLRVTHADAAGRATLTGTTQAADCAVRIQAVDISTCHVSPLTRP